MDQQNIVDWYITLNNRLLEHNAELTEKVIEQQEQLISTKQQYSQKLLELSNENKKLRQKCPQILGMRRDHLTLCFIVYIGYKAWTLYTT